jgi:hypothetical protein
MFRLKRRGVSLVPANSAGPLKITDIAHEHAAQRGHQIKMPPPLNLSYFRYNTSLHTDSG